MSLQDFISFFIYSFRSAYYSPWSTCLVGGSSSYHRRVHRLIVNCVGTFRSLFGYLRTGSGVSFGLIFCSEMYKEFDSNDSVCSSRIIRCFFCGTFFAQMKCCLAYRCHWHHVTKYFEVSVIIHCSESLLNPYMPGLLTEKGKAIFIEGSVLRNYQFLITRKINSMYPISVFLICAHFCVLVKVVQSLTGM